MTLHDEESEFGIAKARSSCWHACQHLSFWMKHSVLDLWGSVRPQEKKSSEKKLIDEIDPSWDISLWYIIKSWHVLKVMPIRASLSKWVDQSLPFWIPVCWVDYLSYFQRKLAEVSQFIKVITAFTVLFLLGTWGCRPPILYLSAHWEREALHLSNLRKPALLFDSSSLKFSLYYNRGT